MIELKLNDKITTCYILVTLYSLIICFSLVKCYSLVTLSAAVSVSRITAWLLLLILLECSATHSFAEMLLEVTGVRKGPTTQTKKGFEALVDPSYVLAHVVFPRKQLVAPGTLVRR